MRYKQLVNSFIDGWNSTRAETLEILDSLDNKKLQFKPKGEKWQKLYWEFGCIGRTQIVYAEAVKTGKMDFSLFHSAHMPKKTDNQTKKSIKKFLEETNKKWVSAIKSKAENEDYKIAWPGFKMPLLNHVASLAEHERLHHGQFISYFTIADFKLPKGFKSNWAL